MKARLIRASASLAVFVGLSLLLVALTWQSRPPVGTAAEHEQGDADAPGGQQRASAAMHVEEDASQEGDEHARDAAGERMGLDDLRKIACEHGPILDCDACRYEVGVARIEPTLAQQVVRSEAVRLERRAARTLQLTGEINLDLRRVVEIASVASGRIERVHRILGDQVRAGETLAVMNSSEFGQAQAAFLEAQSRRELAGQTYERERQLHEQQITSRADYLSAVNDWTAARALLAAARQRLRLFGLTDEQIDSAAKPDAEKALGRLALTTPIDGTVVEQSAVRGRLVNPADTLYRVADLSRVWVLCDVYEPDLTALHERVALDEPFRADVHVTAFPDTVFEATLDMIGSELDRQTRTVKVRLIADNPEGRLKPGMFVKAVLAAGDLRTVLRLPETAVLSDAGQHFVFARLDDALWIRRNVTVGPCKGGLVEIRSGLVDGDVIATRGAFMFKSEVLKEKMGAGCAH